MALQLASLREVTLTVFVAAGLTVKKYVEPENPVTCMVDDVPVSIMKFSGAVPIKATEYVSATPRHALDAPVILAVGR